MNKVTLLIIAACVVISACMISLFRSGIGLRSQTLIRPSFVDEHMEDVAQVVFYRLFPEFQQRELFVIGVDKPSERVGEFLSRLQQQVEKNNNIHIKLYNDSNLLAQQNELQNCIQTCWIQTEVQSTSDIAPMPSVLQLAGLDEKNRFTLSVIEFDNYDPATIEKCENQKRLTLDCLKNLGIKEAQHKMKDANKKYFFLKQYLERDFFLFIQR